jgi:hypothetical protein
VCSMLHLAWVAYFLSGNMPPEDLPFEENVCKTRDHGGTLGRKKPEQKSNKQKKVRKQIQIKREIENKVDSIESDIEKGKMIVMNFKSNTEFFPRPY